MVGFRAATVANDFNKDALIGRNTELFSEAFNTSEFRSTKMNYLLPFNNELLSSVKKLSEQQTSFNFPQAKNKKHTYKNSAQPEPTVVSNKTSVIEIFKADLNSQEQTAHTNSLSLDHENTINSSISLLFPRKQINARPLKD